MRNFLSTCFWVFVTVVATTSQDRPDFSGTWSLVSPTPFPPNAPQTLIVHATFKRQSVSGTPIVPPLVTLSVESRFGNAIRSDTYDVGMSGGVVGGLPANGPRTSSRFSTRWERDRLIVDLARYTDGKLSSEHGEQWSLDAQGLLTIVSTDRTVGEEPTSATLAYRRTP